MGFLYPTSCEYAYILLQEYLCVWFQSVVPVPAKGMTESVFSQKYLSEDKTKQKTAFQNTGCPPDVRQGISVICYDILFAFGEPETDP